MVLCSLIEEAMAIHAIALNSWGSALSRESGILSLDVRRVILSADRQPLSPKA